MKRLLIIFISIGGAAAAALFLISLYLASWSAKPIALAWEKQKQFVADASHELKTPLTVIAANTDVILANSGDSVKNQVKWLNYIKDEIQRMNRLVNSLLYLAKSDFNGTKTERVVFNLSDTVSEVCLFLESYVFESSRILETNIEHKIMHTGDRDCLKQLVTILLDNAVKHSVKNSVIKVELKKESNKKIRLTVSNTGSNIPKEYLDRIFERFYRIDESRSKSTGEFGLGLNIAQTIVLRHKGVISVKSKENFTEFIVVL